MTKEKNKRKRKGYQAFLSIILSLLIFLNSFIGNITVYASPSAGVSATWHFDFDVNDKYFEGPTIEDGESYTNIYSGFNFQASNDIGGEDIKFQAGPNAAAGNLLMGYEDSQPYAPPGYSGNMGIIAMKPGEGFFITSSTSIFDLTSFKVGFDSTICGITLTGYDISGNQVQSVTFEEGIAPFNQPWSSNILVPLTGFTGINKVVITVAKNKATGFYYQTLFNDFHFENIIPISSESNDATIKASSTVKGQPVSLGIPNAVLGSETAGTVGLSSEQAADTSNAGSFVTLFDPNDSNATVKAVKYESGSTATETNFESAAAYANESVSNGDFFIIKAVAKDGSTALYYKVNVIVTPTATITFDTNDLASGSGVYNKPVEGVNFTLSGEDDCSFDNNYGSHYNVFPDSATGIDATKLTISIADGYTFDFNGFGYYTSFLEDTITVTITYANGSTKTGSITATAGGDETISDFSILSNDFPSYGDDVTKVVIQSENGRGSYDFGTNNFFVTDIKALSTVSSNAGLTSVLGQAITAGSEAGTSEAPKTASINVANEVTTVAAADIVKSDTGAEVTFYGTNGSFSLSEAGSINLTEGGATNVYIKVVAADGTTLHYKVTINRAAGVMNPSLYYVTNIAGQPAPGDSLLKINTDGTSKVTILDNNSIWQPNALALDLENNRVFVGNTYIGNSSIYSVDLTTGEPTKICNTTGLPFALCADNVNQKLYFITAVSGQPAAGDSLYSINMDGTGLSLILDNNSIWQPGALVLDIANNRAFVADTYLGNRGIYSVDLTTGEPTKICSVADIILDMYADTVSQKIYFVTGVNGQAVSGDSLMCINMDGSGLKTILDGNTIQQPTSLALDIANNTAFVADSYLGNRAIYSVNLTTGMPIKISSETNVIGKMEITDIIPPVVSNGILSKSNITHNSVDLGWTAANDLVTAQKNLQYKIVYSFNDNLNDINAIESNGTTAINWTPNITNRNVTGLLADTDYYFNVIVKDASGNKAIYSSIRVHTGLNTALSSDAGLASVLGQPITVGSYESGTPSIPKIATINVGSGVTAVAVSDIVKSDAGANVTFYGTNGSFGLPYDGSVNLTAGGATNVYIKVVAADNTTLFYKVTINRAASVTDMNVTGVRFVTFDITQNPMIATIDVEMDDIDLDADNFTVTNDSDPNVTVIVDHASYLAGKYTLTVSGMNVYDSYTLGITKEGYTAYSNDHFYGTLATAEDLDLENEPNKFPTYTRELTEAGIVTIRNQTYAAGAVLRSGAVYNAIDGNNGNPDNGTVTRLIGIFAKAPDGAKGVKTLRPNGQVLQVAEDSLIDGNPNYQETIKSGKDYYNAHKDDPGFIDSNEYWKTLAFVPMYSQIATERQSDNSRILVDPADRFRIIEWYDNEACTGAPIKVIRLMVMVDYSGSITVDPAPISTPTATGGYEYIDVTNVEAGAQLKLYTTDGQLVSTNYRDMGNGTYRFEDVLPHELWYYVEQSVEGKGSSCTTFVNSIFRTPVATGGEGYVNVTNVSSLSTLRLYKKIGETITLVSNNPKSMGDGTYRFEDVIPDRADFYVIQCANNMESWNSNFVGVSLPKPSITGGNKQITVTNVYPGADLTLYAFNGTVLKSETNVTTATYQFSNVAPGSGYYVEQTINGVVSLASNLATVYSSAPQFVGGTQSITVRAYPNVTDLRDQLYVSDLDAGQTLTWTVVSGPSHGTLDGFPVSASTNEAGGVSGTTGSTDIRIPDAVGYRPSSGYDGDDSFTIQVSDGTATDTRTIHVGVNLVSSIEVTANNSAELEEAINDPAVATINLKAGTTYQIMGAEINRPLTINGNHAVIEALGGVGRNFDNQTIYHLGMPDKDGNRRYRGNLFWYVKDGGSLTVKNLTLKNTAVSENGQGLTGIFAAILLNEDADLSLTGVSVENFWFKNSKLAEQNNLFEAHGLYSSYSDISYGVYADYNCTGDITVSNSTFGSSNAFRDAIHIYNGNSVSIKNCTLTGTEHPDRLRESDRYEYGMFLYGGNCSVINNTISGYDSKKNADYSSSGIAFLPYYNLSAVIEDNTIEGNDCGLDITGGWKTLNPAPTVEINGIKLNTEDNGFKIGEGLNASNTVSGSTGANIYIKLDQNDDGNAFVYYSPFLSVSGTNTIKPTLNFSQTADAIALISSAKTIEIQTSEDNGQSWTTALVEGILNNSSTSAVVNLEANKTYTLRVKMTHDNNQTPNTVITGYSNAITLTTLSSETGIESILSQPIAAGIGEGTKGDPKTVSIDVQNSVATVALSNIVKSDAAATVTFYGTDNTFTTPAGGSVNLTQGAATEVYIKVTAADGTILYYKVIINRAVGAMNVTGVNVTAFTASQTPSQATLEVAMDDIGLDESAFAVNNITTPGSAVTVNKVAYSGGKYVLSVSGMTYYDSYSLTVTKTGYTTYTNSNFYGKLAEAKDLDLVHEPNMFLTYGRELVSSGTVSISNGTYAANDKLYSGPVYTAIDTNNGNPDNGTITRLIGIFVKAPEGAKGAKTLKLNGQMEKVTEDSLIDSNPNYQETVASGKEANHNDYWKTIAFLPLYTQIASERQLDGSRILVDPADRFRIIEWYDNAECTGEPLKVTRLMVTVEYTGTPVSTDAGLASILGQTITAGPEAGTSGTPKTASIDVANETTAVSAKDIIESYDGAAVTFYGTDSTFTNKEAGSVTLAVGVATDVYIKVIAVNGMILYYKVTIHRAANGDAGLSSVLDQAVTAGEEAGTLEAPKTASIDVANVISAVSAKDIVKSHAGATVTFYGTDRTFTTAEAASVNLLENGATTVYIKVTAQDTTTTTYYAVTINRTGSSNTGLGSILDQAVTAGSEAGTLGAPKTASIHVENSVSTVSVADIVKSHAGETVTFYGTDRTFTTAEAASVNLLENGATTVYIKVTAQDTTTTTYYAVTINRTASSDTGLGSILSQAVTAGPEAGTLGAPKTASIHVENSVSTVSASDIVKSHAGETVTFYGTDSTFTTPASGSVSLASGRTTTIYLKITAQDNTTVRYYAVTIDRAASTDSGPAPNPATDKVEQITVDVKQGETDNTVAQISIERTTHTDGSKSDKVTYQEEKARETITKLKEEGKDVARILIPSSDSAVTKTQVTIPSVSLNTLSEGQVNLQIDTEDAKIDLPKTSLAQVSKKLEGDLYFHLVPVKEEEKKREVTQRVISEVKVINNNESTNISALGIPMTIETNMPSTAADITLPLSGISIPSDSVKRKAFLEELAVYIEHSDGEKELVRGELVEYKPGVFGIKFRITKFSTFTIVKMKKSSTNGGNTITNVPVFYMVKNMSVGNTFTLTLTGIKDTANVVYKSSNANVVSVTSTGTLRAKKNGTAVVTAIITQNGSQYKVQIKIKVQKGMPFNRSISKSDAISVNTGLPVLNIYKRVAVGNKTNVTIKNIAKDAVVTYSSDNTRIATVSKTGVIKGKAGGECVVTAKIKQDGKTYCYKILVRVPKTK